MLEASDLLFNNWRRDAENQFAWTRAVVDAVTAAPLGTVRTRGRSEGWWLARFRGERLEVVESEDSALLMTLIKPWVWSRGWEIDDAEERRVGTITGPLLLDAEGGQRGLVDDTGPARGRILGPEGHTLAEYERCPDQATLLQFAEDLEANPFLRMLLVSCVLAKEPPPRAV